MICSLSFQILGVSKTGRNFADLSDRWPSIEKSRQGQQQPQYLQCTDTRRRHSGGVPRARARTRGTGSAFRERAEIGDRGWDGALRRTCDRDADLLHGRFRESSLFSRRRQPTIAFFPSTVERISLFRMDSRWRCGRVEKECAFVVAFTRACSSSRTRAGMKPPTKRDVHISYSLLLSLSLSLALSVVNSLVCRFIAVVAAILTRDLFVRPRLVCSQMRRLAVFWLANCWRDFCPVIYQRALLIATPWRSADF